MEQHTEAAQLKLETLKKIVEGAKVAMLVTHSLNDNLVSRPMQLQEVEFDGDIWFLTRSDTNKYEEIQKNPKVNVVIADKSYASIAGTAEIVNDPARQEQYWSKAYEAMFDLQANDPLIKLIKINAESAEYWDTGATVKSVFNFVKKVVGQEEPVEPGKNTNETLEL